jgi:hypothetical protein
VSQAIDATNHHGEAMTLNDPDFRPLDPGRVNTMDPVEPERLQSAVDAVGEHVAEVREWLAHGGPG